MSEDLFGYMAVAIVFYLVGRWVGRTSALLHMARGLIENRADITRVLKEYEDDLRKEQAEESAEEVKVERHADVYYLYTKVKDEFISQGSSLQDALEQARKRFPDRKFKGYLTKEEAKELGIEAPKS